MPELGILGGLDAVAGAKLLVELAWVVLVC